MDVDLPSLSPAAARGDVAAAIADASAVISSSAASATSAASQPNTRPIARFHDAPPDEAFHRAAARTAISKALVAASQPRAEGVLSGAQLALKLKSNTRMALPSDSDSSGGSYSGSDIGSDDAEHSDDHPARLSLDQLSCIGIAHAVKTAQPPFDVPQLSSSTLARKQRQAELAHANSERLQRITDLRNSNPHNNAHKRRTQSLQLPSPPAPAAADSSTVDEPSTASKRQKVRSVRAVSFDNASSTFSASAPAAAASSASADPAQPPSAPASAPSAPTAPAPSPPKRALRPPANLQLTRWAGNSCAYDAVLEQLFAIWTRTAEVFSGAELAGLREVFQQRSAGPMSFADARALFYRLLRSNRGFQGTATYFFVFGEDGSAADVAEGALRSQPALPSNMSSAIEKVDDSKDGIRRRAPHADNHPPAPAFCVSTTVECPLHSVSSAPSERVLLPVGDQFRMASVNIRTIQRAPIDSLVASWKSRHVCLRTDCLRRGPVRLTALPRVVIVDLTGNDHWTHSCGRFLDPTNLLQPVCLLTGSAVQHRLVGVVYRLQSVDRGPSCAHYTSDILMEGERWRRPRPAHPRQRAVLATTSAQPTDLRAAAPAFQAFELSTARLRQHHFAVFRAS